MRLCGRGESLLQSPNVDTKLLRDLGDRVRICIIRIPAELHSFLGCARYSGVQGAGILRVLCVGGGLGGCVKWYVDVSWSISLSLSTFAIATYELSE